MRSSEQLLDLRACLRDLCFGEGQPPRALCGTHVAEPRGASFAIPLPQESRDSARYPVAALYIRTSEFDASSEEVVLRLTDVHPGPGAEAAPLQPLVLLVARLDGPDHRELMEDALNNAAQLLQGENQHPDLSASHSVTRSLSFQSSASVMAFCSVRGFEWYGSCGSSTSPPG